MPYVKSPSLYGKVQDDHIDKLHSFLDQLDSALHYDLGNYLKHRYVDTKD